MEGIIKNEESGLARISNPELRDRLEAYLGKLVTISTEDGSKVRGIPVRLTTEVDASGIATATTIGISIEDA